MTTKRRISLTQYDAAHLYNLALEHFCVSEKEGKCVVCVVLKRRLEKFIGEKEVKYIQKQVKRYGYCKHQTSDV